MKLMLHGFAMIGLAASGGCWTNSTAESDAPATASAPLGHSGRGEMRAMATPSHGAGGNPGTGSESKPNIPPEGREAYLEASMDVLQELRQRVRSAAHDFLERDAIRQLAPEMPWFTQIQTAAALPQGAGVRG